MRDRHGNRKKKYLAQQKTPVNEEKTIWKLKRRSVTLMKMNCTVGRGDFGVAENRRRREIHNHKAYIGTLETSTMEKAIIFWKRVLSSIRK